MIQIRDLTKYYGDLLVLDRVSLSIPRGIIYGLIGRSGVGKSTLLRCINGLEPYQGGSLLVQGEEIRDKSKEALMLLRKNIGMIFQQFSLLNRMDVYQNIAFPMRSWKYDKKVIDKKVRELLELVDLRDKIHARPAELSGGQKQRVAIARALSMDPVILLCDEATSALDPKTAASITALLDRINRELGITIVVVTHQMSILRRICQEITILEEGRVAVSGAVQDIFLNQHPALISLVGEQQGQVSDDALTLKIILPSEYSQTPLITQMVKELSLDFVIVGGDMEQFRDQWIGSVLIRLEMQDFHRVASYLDARSIPWKRMGRGE